MNPLVAVRAYEIATAGDTSGKQPPGRTCRKGSYKLHDSLAKLLPPAPKDIARTIVRDKSCRNL